MNLVILCEGDTEVAVLKDFLTPFCTNFNAIRLINAKGAGKLRSKFKQLAETELQSDPDSIVFCLIDVYQTPFNYPKAIAASVAPHREQYAYIKQYMEKAITANLQERFFAFPVVMEIETWILADVEALNEYFKPNRHQAIKTVTTPENIQHPADEIERLWQRFKKSDYDKVRHGKRLFQHVQAQRVYDDNCPHFEAMINQLLRLQGLPLQREEPQFEIPNAELYYQLATLEKRRDDILDKALESNPPASNELLAEAVAIENEMEALNRRIIEIHQSDD